MQARKGASGKRQSLKARGSRGQGKKKGKGEGSGSGPSQPAVPPDLRGLRAAAAVAAAAREAPAPQRLRMPQGVPPNARQQWAEAYTVTCHKVLDACANAHGTGVRADVLQAVQEFGTLARTVFAYSRGRRSGAAAAARVTKIAHGLPLDDAAGEERPERNVGPRRPRQAAARRQAARIERCLHQKRSIHRAAWALHDRKPADARDPRVRVSLHAAHPADVPALQLTDRPLAEQVKLLLPSNSALYGASSRRLLQHLRIQPHRRAPACPIYNGISNVYMGPP